MVLKILHLHRPPHAPLPGPTLQAGQLLLRHLCTGGSTQLVASGAGGPSEALTPQASNQMLPPISEECVLVRALNQTSQLSDFSPILLK